MSNIGNKQTMSKNLKYYVERTNKMQKEVAEDLGVAASTFTEWIKGNKYPRIDKIQKMAEYFGIEKRDLVEERIVQNVTESQLLTAFRKADTTTQGIILKILGIEKR